MRQRDPEKEELVRKKAVELVVREGLEGFSVNKLAKACGISVATLYIYYKDRDDLIISIAKETLRISNETMLKDFDSSFPFARGLRVQWKNRIEHYRQNPDMVLFMEQVKSSTYFEHMAGEVMQPFKQAMEAFTKNAVKNNEIDAMPLEVYWCIAYGPLYSLLNFARVGRSVGGKIFELTDEIIWETFDRCLKALTKK